MEGYNQDSLLIIEALRRLAEDSPNDIIAEHAWVLAEQIAAEEAWLPVDDAVQLLEYDINW